MKTANDLNASFEAWARSEGYNLRQLERSVTYGTGGEVVALGGYRDPEVVALFAGYCSGRRDEKKAKR